MKLDRDQDRSRDSKENGQRNWKVNGKKLKGGRDHWRGSQGDHFLGRFFSKHKIYFMETKLHKSFFSETLICLCPYTLPDFIARSPGYTHLDQLYRAMLLFGYHNSKRLSHEIVVFVISVVELVLLVVFS